MLPSMHPTVNARVSMGPHLSRVKPPGRVLGACIIAKDCPCPLVMPSAIVSPSGQKSDLQQQQGRCNRNEMIKLQSSCSCLQETLQTYTGEAFAMAAHFSTLRIMTSAVFTSCRSP